MTKLAPLFQAAGKKALESWDKHIDPALKLLTRRFQYDPRIPPAITGYPSQGVVWGAAGEVLPQAAH